MSRKEVQAQTVEARNRLTKIKTLHERTNDELTSSDVAALCSHFKVVPYYSHLTSESYEKARRAADRFVTKSGHTLFICKGVLYVHPNPF